MDHKNAEIVMASNLLIWQPILANNNVKISSGKHMKTVFEVNVPGWMGASSKMRNVALQTK